jgi:hypothetical protein
MGITITSSPSVSEDSIRNISKKSKRFENKEARRADRETRRAEREAKRESRKNPSGGDVSIPENNQTTPPPSGSTGTGSQTTGTQSTSGTSSTPPATSPKSKSFSIGDLNGANVVNFAVQGRAGGSSEFSVFASGKGPGAIDTEKKAASTTTTENTTTQDNTTGAAVNTTA